MSETVLADGDLVVRARGALRRITLNRPQALNAITLDMAVAMTALLRSWADDPGVGAILIDGAGERAFCAGGDIRALYDAAKSGAKSGTALPERFWATEYRLNVLIARYAKPLIAVMDGVVMGGGVGLSVYASHRVVTERSAVAMPEVGIGFFPDVGVSFLLARAPGFAGTHLALTGSRVGAADAIDCGLADICVPAARLAEIPAAVAGCHSGEEVRARLGELSAPAAAGRLPAARPWIDRCFDADTVEAIIERLRARGEDDAHAALAAMQRASPTSLKVTLRNLRSALSFGRVEDSFQQDYRIALACIAGHDFIEGIRATIVDKDRNPAWRPDSLAGVTAAIVDRHFQSVGALELKILETKEETHMATIGFIGLGNMGAPMAANLVKSGGHVLGFDVVAALCEASTGDGVQIVANARSTVENTDVVITMLPGGAHVLAVWNDILPLARQGTLFIDCSTIDVADARKAHALAAGHGIATLDAPVSGGVGGAKAATLTFMVGGSEHAFARGKPVLERMGKRIVHCGEAGNGQAAKICNNMILGASMIAVGEAFVLGEKLGLSHQALFDVAAASSGQCWSLTSYCPVPGPVPASPANHGYKAGFTAALMLKDLKLAREAAASVHAATALGAHAAEIYQEFAQRGHGALDFSAIINLVRSQSDAG